eukprot:3561496-Prymnesium_polylepis.1
MASPTGFASSPLARAMLARHRRRPWTVGGARCPGAPTTMFLKTSEKKEGRGGTYIDIIRRLHAVRQTT